MFKNLKQLNAGKVKIKVIATLLVMTLTFTNFALLRFTARKIYGFICSRN
ncbi:MAG: hypothetical protein Q4G09_04410 [Clostridia bacterium]|nr:hypothetical protein [Clostridia bacterium]